MNKKFLVLLVTLLVIMSACFITVFATDTGTPNLTIAGASLSLKNAVYINFKVIHENMEAKNVKLLIWDSLPTEYKKDTETVCLDYLGTDSDGYAVFQYDNLTAKNMTKMVYACAYTMVDGVEYYSDPVKYSILTYAYNMKDTTDTNLKNLLDGMLQYGALSQLYFNYNKDFLATDTVYKITVNQGMLEDGFTHGLYQEGKVANLTANEAEEGYAFSHWENSVGETVGEESTLTVTVSGEEVYTAVYEEIPKELDFTLSKDGTYYIVSGIGTYIDTDVIIPSMYNNKVVKAIDDYAFSGCSHLTSVTIPDSVISIGESAFVRCTNLTSIEIPNSVQIIKDFAFEYCKNLSEITLGKNISSIGADIFDGTAYYNNKKNWINDVLYIDNYLIEADLGYGVRDYTVINGTAVIADNAFYAPDLENISLPDSIKFIGESAFISTAFYQNQDNWDGKVLYIGKHLIYISDSLEDDMGGNVISTDYTIKEGTLSIASGALTIYTGRRVILPNSIRSISHTVCNGSGGVSIEYNGTIKEWNEICFAYDWSIDDYGWNSIHVECYDGRIKYYNGSINYYYY